MLMGAFLYRKNIFILALVAFVSGGCFGPTRPNLDREPWKSMTVYYCVGSTSPVTEQSWSTQDPQILETLRRSLIVSQIDDLWGLVTYRYNRLEILLVNGDKWDMHFFESTKLSVLKQPSPPTSFRLVVEPNFFSQLNTLISSSNDVHFFYPTPVEVKRQAYGDKSR